MKPMYEFIVEIPKSHDDELKIKGTDVVLKLDVRHNQGERTIREGKIVAVPTKFDTRLDVDDIVIIDKNILTFQVHSDSLINKSQFLIDEEKGWYRVPLDMIYLYKKNNKDEWNCPAPYLFVRPIKSTQQKKGDIIYKGFDDYKGYKEQYGTVEILNEAAKATGLKKGDMVYYKKDREYEFTVDGELLYHMDNEDVLVIVENMTN